MKKLSIPPLVLSIATFGIPVVIAHGKPHEMSQEEKQGKKCQLRIEQKSYESSNTAASAIPVPGQTAVALG
jgi:hypothetical protein